MDRITPEHMPYVEKAPRFIEAVRAAKRTGSPVIERLESFDDDPFLLYSCLWYAWSEGVAVTFQAPRAHTR